jgi:3-ketosteroid 9alpha-monooxygenase subunit B
VRGSCQATVLKGRVLMRGNDVLDDDDIAQGNVLGCQSVSDPDGEGEELYIRF